MIPHDPPHQCTSCTIPHIDNCPDCFGYGVRPGGVPIRAREGIDGIFEGDAFKCPTCGSTPKRTFDALQRNLQTSTTSGAGVSRSEIEALLYGISG